MRALHFSVVLKRELSSKAELSVFKLIFISIFTYGHEFWVMTRRVLLYTGDVTTYKSGQF